MKELIKKHEKNIPIAVIDGVTILGRDVDEENHTVYVVEKDGKKDVVLYNQIDQTKLPEKEEDRVVTITKKTDTGMEQIKLSSHDNFGNKTGINFELEKDKFIHPEKYPKGKPLDQLIPPV